MRNYMVAVPIIGCLASLIPFEKVSAQEKVGNITKIVAWRNVQPPSNNKIIAIGRITAPNPCYTTETNKVENKVKGLIAFKITLKAGTGMCIKVISDVDFRYEQDGEVNGFTEVEAVSETDRKKAPIGTAS